MKLFFSPGNVYPWILSKHEKPRELEVYFRKWRLCQIEHFVLWSSRLSIQLIRKLSPCWSVNSVQVDKLFQRYRLSFLHRCYPARSYYKHYDSVTRSSVTEALFCNNVWLISKKLLPFFLLGKGKHIKYYSNYTIFYTNYVIKKCYEVQRTKKRMSWVRLQTEWFYSSSNYQLK